jgi:hypothetical protein
MMCLAPFPAVRGNFVPHSPSTMLNPPSSSCQCSGVEPAEPVNALERLAQLVVSNDQLIDELTCSRARIVSALTYLDQPGCNARFGSAHLERCRNRHSEILAQLRANRLEALELLAHPARSND